MSNAARGRVGAGIPVQAWVDAVLVSAGPVQGAVVVDVAFDLGAVLVRVSCESRRAAALGGVVLSLADGVDGAAVVNEAIVDTLVVVADLVGAAVAVDHALN